MNEDEKRQVYELAEKLIAEQNLIAAIVVGAVSAVLAAIAYGIISPFLGHLYGFAAVGVGIAIGVSMQFLGRGIDTIFAVVASAYTIAGCLLGNVFSLDRSLARTALTAPRELFLNDQVWSVTKQAISNISFVDLVYWFVAVFAAVFLAMRALSRR